MGIEGDTNSDVGAKREPLLGTRGRSDEKSGRDRLGSLGGGDVGAVPATGRPVVAEFGVGRLFTSCVAELRIEVLVYSQEMGKRVACEGGSSADNGTHYAVTKVTGLNVADWI